MYFILGYIGYHSRFDPECNTERCYIESLSIALGIFLFLDKHLKFNFWKGHKSLRLSNVKTKRETYSNFVAFSQK
jgi:hypothetical protein